MQPDQTVNEISSARGAPVRLGIVGMGQFGRLHALTAARVAEVRLVALVARRAESLSNLGEPLSDIACWTELDRAVEESDAEAWIVATSTASHVAVARTLLSAGKFVLLEKPIAARVADAESLADLVHPDSSNLMMGHVLLFNSEFRQIMDEIDRRGPIDYIDCVRHRPATTLDAYPDESPFHLTMVHDLYIVQVLTRRADPTHMSAQSHQTSDGRTDLALAQLRWADGTVASLTASFMTPDGMASGGFDRMEIFGQGWAARLRANPRPIEVWDDRARWPLGLEIRTAEPAATGMLAEQLRCFCRVVRGLEFVPVGATYGDAVQVQRWLERLTAESGC